MPAGRLAPVLRYLRTVNPDGEAPADVLLLRRFAVGGDGEAFAELVRRHGPMVLGTCRRLLRDHHDADDAFQATFLLLARKAGSLRQPDLLGGWLHGVACRTAAKARALAARRRQRQQPLADRAADPSDDLLWRDLRPVLDDAIGALPAKYRTPFVLCYLEGLTNAEAAHRLGCPPGTIATRLARARQRLRARLAARGLGPAAALAVAVSAGESARAAVPAALAGATARAALGAATASAGAIALMKGVWRNMLMERVRFFVVALAAVGMAAGGAGWLTYRARAVEPPAVIEEPRVVPPQPAGPPPAPAAIAPPAVPVPPALEGPTEAATFRTTNFIVTAPSRRIARLVAEAAERHRKEQALRWLGKEMPDWKKPCPIQVTITLSGCGGATSFAFDNGRVLDQNMHLEGALDRILANALPHEVTHTVFAHHFRCAVPRWADEGGCVLSEDEEEVQRHEKMARSLVAAGRAIPLRRLLALRDFPPDVMALFAQGTSLTHFLVKRKDHKTFLQFITDGKDGDWDKALAKHYGYQKVEDLEAALLATLKTDRKAARKATEPAADKPGVFPPAPWTALARLDEEGKLILRRPHTVYVPRKVTAWLGRGDAVTKTVYVAVIREAVLECDFDEVRAYGTDGKRVGAKALAKALAGRREVAVLVSADGKPVDAFHLQVVKEGTLILVVSKPEASPEPAPLLPPTAAPAVP